MTNARHQLLKTFERILKKDERRLEILDFESKVAIVSREFNQTRTYEVAKVVSIQGFSVKKITYTSTEFNRTW